MQGLELTLAIIVGLLAYAGSLWMWPYRNCRRCKGRGTNIGSNRRRYGSCGRCKGSRRVPRLGAKQVWQLVRKRQP